jgi:hypothetical protein
LTSFLEEVRDNSTPFTAKAFKEVVMETFGLEPDGVEPGFRRIAKVFREKQLAQLFVKDVGAITEDEVFA